MNGCGARAKVLLKARPTAAQIADRLAPPVPDGLEFYLDTADISGTDWRQRLVKLATAERPTGFEYVVEGPLRSLDGSFFDATLLSTANREVIDRLVSFGEGIGARAAVIHAMAARPSALPFGPVIHAQALDKALSLFRYYSATCQSAGLIPTVENVPTVARMREGSYMYSLIGTPPSDIAYLVDQVPGLRATVDVSHAQLYVNAFNASHSDVPPELQPIVRFIQDQDGVGSLDEYIDQLAAQVIEAHISNARGLLGEGLPYFDGELDLNRVVRRLGSLASFLVTETIEPNADQATLMREAQRQMDAVLGLSGGRKDDND